MMTTYIQRLFVVLPLAIAGSLSAQENKPDKDLPLANPMEQHIEPGMPAALAIRLLGREPDGKTEIGAACGMLEILTWRDEQTRIITNGGIVASVNKSSQ